MTPLDPHNTAFDRFDRLRQMARTLERLDPSGQDAVLDVGGFPALLADAMPRREVWTLDRPECDREQPHGLH